MFPQQALFRSTPVGDAGLEKIMQERRFFLRQNPPSQ